MNSRHVGRGTGARLPLQASRRDFLWLSGVGLATLTLSGTLSGAALAEKNARESAAAGVAPGPSVKEEFEEAAEEHRVPVDVLLAIGYVNTRWRMPPAEANEYREGDLHGWGSYGIMALVQNPFSDTLGEASRLTKIPEEELKTDRRANIFGGAALLARALGKERPPTLEGYWGAVAGKGRAPAKNFEAVAGIGAGELFAEQVFEVLENGVREEVLESRERLSLEPHDLNERLDLRDLTDGAGGL